MSQVSGPGPAGEVPLKRILFSASAEAGIRALSNWMQVAAVVSILSGVVKFATAFGPRFNAGHIVDAMLSVLIGAWIYQAATAIRKVANTDVADQQNLMEAFRTLRKVYLLQSVLIIVTVAMLLVALIVAAVFMLPH